MTQYDTRTLLFTIDKSDFGQEITGLASGTIESMHNLPVSLEGAGIPGAANGSEAAVNEVPEFTGGVNGVEAAIAELPEFTGGVNGSEAAVHGSTRNSEGGGEWRRGCCNGAPRVY